MKYIITPVKVHHVVLTATLLTARSVSVSFPTPSCRPEFDLDYDSYHEDYYDRYCQKAHTPYCSHTLLLVCVSQEAKADSSSPLFLVVSALRRCLPHSCQSSCLCLQHYLLLLNSHELTCHTHTQIHTHSKKYIFPCIYRVAHLYTPRS